MKQLILILGIVILGNLCTGCALTPYMPMEVRDEGMMVFEMPEGESQIERGRPVALVDGIGHYVFALPSKLLLLNWNVDNHDISAKTERAIREYLLANNMTNVKVRLNQYAPGAEWRRLFKNRSMPAIWRYTVGLVSVAYYTIMPGRIFGGDHYNPYTNTINLFSDIPAIALHEAGHAKDTAKRERWFRGPYSMMRIVPGVTLYQEALATGDALGYLKSVRDTDAERDAYKILYPAYGSYMAGTALNYMNPLQWINYTVMYGTAWTMKVVGHIKAGNVEDSIVEPDAPVLAEPMPL